MKILKTTLFSLLLVSGLANAENPLLNATHQFINATPVEKAKTSSYTFKQNFGSESIQIEFPKKPKTKKKDGILEASASKDKISYLFLAPKPQASVDANSLFDFMFDEIEECSCTILEENIYDEGDNTILEFKVESPGGYKNQTKIIVTPDNFYVITVDYPKKKENSSIEHFINSFEFLN